MKHSGLGFGIPYVLPNGRSHDYVPAFIVRLAGEAGQWAYVMVRRIEDLATTVAGLARVAGRAG